MTASTKQESELEYLRLLKDNNNRTIQHYGDMVTVRQQVIERKDIYLHVIAAQVETILQNIEESHTPSILEPLIRPLKDIEANTRMALNVGIKPKE